MSGVENVMIKKDEVKIEETNSLIEKQMNNIQQEVIDNQPYISNLSSIKEIVNEYSGDQTAPEFIEKAQILASNFKLLRRIRGDGNCFYRAVLYAVAEMCINNLDLAKKFQSRIQNSSTILLTELAYPSETTLEFCEIFKNLMNDIVEGKITDEQHLMATFSGELADYFVFYGRLLTSGYLQKHSEQYAPFLVNYGSMKEFCGSEIDPMYKDVDHIGVIGLANALGLQVVIEYMDRSHSLSGSMELQIDINDKSNQIFDKAVILLYRPGHYDILYK